MLKKKIYSPLQAVLIRERLLAFIHLWFPTLRLPETTANKLIFLSEELDGAIGYPVYPEKHKDEDEKGRTFKGYDREMALKHNTFENFITGKVQSISSGNLNIIAGLLITKDMLSRIELDSLGQKAFKKIPFDIDRAANMDSRSFPDAAEYYCGLPLHDPERFNRLLIAKEDRIAAFQTAHACQFVVVGGTANLDELLIRDLRNSQGEAPVYHGFLYFSAPNEAHIVEFFGRRPRTITLRNLASNKDLMLEFENLEIFPLPYTSFSSIHLTNTEFKVIMSNNKFKFVRSKNIECEASMLTDAFNIDKANSKLIEAVEAGNPVDLAQAVLEGADVNYHSPEDGNTPLHWCAKTSNFDLYEMLSNSGARWRMTEKYYLPIHYDEFGGQEAVHAKWFAGIKKLNPLVQNADGLFPSACIEKVNLAPRKDDVRGLRIKKFFDDVLAGELAAAVDAGKEYNDLLRQNAHPFPHLGPV